MAILTATKTMPPDGQDDAYKILPILETQQEDREEIPNILMVGDLPILRFIKDGTQGGSTSAVQPSHQLPFQDKDKDKEEQATVAIDPPQISISLEKREGHRLNDPSSKINTDDDGWTLVTRRRKRSGFQAAQHWRTQQTPLQMHASKLRQQQKCFRCLLKGHIQRMCRNPRRCLHCNNPGHIIRDCPSRPMRNPKVHPKDANGYKSQDLPASPSASPKHHPPPFQHTFPAEKPTHPTKLHTTMAVPREWATMIMNEGSVLWQQRPESLDVYIAPREDLSPANRFLERSAFVFAGPAANDPTIHRRIADCMGRFFHMSPAEIPVFTIHQEFGDMLIIFPTEEMAQAAIERASFYVGNNTEISLHPYAPQLQMVFDPMGGRARINLYGLPLQHWNRIDMCTLVSGFGYPLRVAPYFHNGNYEYLTMFVACKKPEKIPFHLKLRVNPYKKKVRVEIDGWLDNQGPPPPPQNRGGHSDNRRHRDGGHHREDAPRNGHHQQDGSVNGQRDRGRASSRGPRHHRTPSSSGSNWDRAAAPWMDNLRRQLLAAGVINQDGLSAPIQSEKGESKIHTQPDQGGFIPGSTLAIRANSENQQHQVMQNRGYSTFCLMSATGNLMGGNQADQGRIVCNLTNGEFYLGNGPMDEECLTGKGVSSVIIEELADGGFQKDGRDMVLVEVGDTNVAPQNVIAVSDESGMQQGPPPGFEHQPPSILQQGTQFSPVAEGPLDMPDASATASIDSKASPGGLGLLVQGEGNIKRSARLKAKTSKVNYSAAAGKRSYKKKYNKAKGAKLEYLNSLNPLDMEQAKLVIQLAGVELQGDIENEVANMVRT
ncbi:Gag-Pol polyprotein [Carex littledalei]|uniref:Gag-Pol polyprotein n=1 Tax=Carex littledalei TaxID=544730 RepID=A0A833VEX0_9POAL|nr:Gag-Pol polyprotein [Carex littledalei]